MRKTKYIAVAGALVALAAPSAAMADAPSGIAFNPASGFTGSEITQPVIDSKLAAIAAGDNVQAWGSSALIQNGQFISGKASGDPDWMHQKGSRSEQVQKELALTDRGSLKVK